MNINCKEPMSYSLTKPINKKLLIANLTKYKAQKNEVLHEGFFSHIYWRNSWGKTFFMQWYKKHILVFKTWKYKNDTQLTLTCSKSTIEALEKGVKYVQVNNKNTRMTSMTSFWCFYC